MPSAIRGHNCSWLGALSCSSCCPGRSKIGPDPAPLTVRNQVPGVSQQPEHQQTYSGALSSLADSCSAADGQAVLSSQTLSPFQQQGLSHQVSQGWAPCYHPTKHAVSRQWGLLSQAQHASRAGLAMHGSTWCEDGRRQHHGREWGVAGVHGCHRLLLLLRLLWGLWLLALPLDLLTGHLCVLLQDSPVTCAGTALMKLTWASQRG